METWLTWVLENIFLCALIAFLHHLVIHLWSWRAGKGKGPGEQPAQGTRSRGLHHQPCCPAPLRAQGPPRAEATQPPPPVPPSTSQLRERDAAEPRQLRLQPGVRTALRSHVAKKGTEIRLEALPAVARQSWRRLRHRSWPALPKPIGAGAGTLQPRRAALPFALREAVGRVELTMQRQRLDSRLGLTMLHVDSVGSGVPRAPSGCAESLEVGVPMLEQREACHRPEPIGTSRQGPKHLAPELRARLQSHVAKKCLELRLGAPPAPVHRSWQAVAWWERVPLARPIRASNKPPQPRAGSLLFLPAAALHALDTNVQQKHQVFLWGLPWCYPEPWAAAIPMPGPARTAILPSLGETLERHELWQWLQQDWDLPGAVQRCRWNDAKPPADTSSCLQLYVLPHSRYCTQLHVQIQGTAAPPASRRSALYGPVQLGPARGSKSSERMVRKVKLASTRCRAAEVVAAPETLGQGLVGGDARKRLETHVHRKRLQHAWGLLALVQGSLGAFEALAPGTPPRPLAPLQLLAPAAVHVPARRPAGLSAEAWQRLEAHLQRQAAEHRWGLPRRVQESLRKLRPPSPAAPTPLCREAPATAELGHEPGVPSGWCCCTEAGAPPPAGEPEGASSQDASQPSSGDELLGPPGAFHQAPEPWAEKEAGPDPAPSGGSCVQPAGYGELDSGGREMAGGCILSSTRWLDTHMAQRALGCFLLPPCVIESLSLFADTAAVRARDAARHGRAQLSRRLHSRAAKNSDQSEVQDSVPPDALGRWHQPEASWETPAREPPSRACSSRSATSEDRPPGSPQEVPGMETESQGDEEASSNGAEPGTSLPPSEFSTESEWERVGDWDRDEADAWGRGGREELSFSPSRSSSEEPPEGGDARDPRWEQGGAWSRDPRWEQMTIIRRILEKRLGLQHGLRYWERSREHGCAAWAHEARAAVAGVMQQ